jgi:hypothetical protein
MRRYLNAVVLGALVSVLLAAQILPATAEENGGLLEGTADQVVSQAEDIVEGVTETVASGTGSVPTSSTSQSASAAEGDGGGGEDDHAAATVAELLIAGEDAIEVGSTSSEIHEDGSTSSDVTVLALGGQEVAGSHSDSEGGGESSNDALAPVCEGSSGQLCLGLLYAKSSAKEDSKSSSADSDAALVYACGGGSSTDPEAECNGPADIAVGESHSTIERDKKTGSTSADADSDLVELCLGGRAEDGSCSGLGANAVHSESHSDAPDQKKPGTASRDSYLLGLDVAGEHHEVLGDPTELSIPPDCPDAGAACVFLNEGETHIRIGGADANQDALHLVVKLPNLGNLIELRLGHSETSVHNPGPEVDEPEDEVKGERQHKPQPKKADRPPTVAAGNLPFTGGNVLSLIMLALMLASTGAFTWIRSRTQS